MSKIILIGGPPRCGKTTLAQKISREIGIMWVSTDAFDDIVQEYNDSVFEETSLVKSIQTTKNELEQLCYAIKSSIQSNLFSLEEDKIKQLDSRIDTTLDRLIDIDKTKKKEEITGKKKEVSFRLSYAELREPL